MAFSTTVDKRRYTRKTEIIGYPKKHGAWMEFECTKCGMCCRDPNTNIQIGKSDIDRWIDEDLLLVLGLLRRAKLEDGTRSWILPKCRDIEEQLAPLSREMGRNLDWTTMKDNPACYFITNENLCAIQQTKPRVCRTFPYCNPEYPCPGIRKRLPEKKCRKIIKENSKDFIKGWTVYSEPKFRRIMENLFRKRAQKS